MLQGLQQKLATTARDYIFGPLIHANDWFHQSIAQYTQYKLAQNHVYHLYRLIRPNYAARRPSKWLYLYRVFICLNNNDYYDGFPSKPFVNKPKRKTLRIKCFNIFEGRW